MEDLEHPDITYARATGEDPTEPRTVRACTCDVCGEDLGDGEDYYDILHHIICTRCIRGSRCTAYAEVDTYYEED